MFLFESFILNFITKWKTAEQQIKKKEMELRIIESCLNLLNSNYRIEAYLRRQRQRQRPPAARRRIRHRFYTQFKTEDTEDFRK